MQYNTIQYNTIQYNTIQYNTIQYNTIQYNTVQYNTIQYIDQIISDELQYSRKKLIFYFTCPDDLITWILSILQNVNSAFG